MYSWLLQSINYKKTQILNSSLNKTQSKHFDFFTMNSLLSETIKSEDKVSLSVTFFIWDTYALNSLTYYVKY